MRMLLLIWHCLAGCIGSVAQSGEPALSVRFRFGTETLEPGRPYPLGSDTVVVDVCRFYLSGIQLHRAGQVVWAESDSYHLVDLRDSQTHHIPLAVPAGLAYDTLVYGLGVDSLTQAGGVRGGALDPLQGMYWTWQSGYIHFKLEGSCASCPDRGKSFQLHLGGYLAPWSALQTLRAAVPAGHGLACHVDLKPVLLGADLSHTPRVMSPGERSVLLSRLVAENMQIHVVE